MFIAQVMTKPFSRYPFLYQPGGTPRSGKYWHELLLLARAKTLIPVELSRCVVIGYIRHYNWLLWLNVNKRRVRLKRIHIVKMYKHCKNCYHSFAPSFVRDMISFRPPFYKLLITLYPVDIRNASSFEKNTISSKHKYCFHR